MLAYWCAAVPVLAQVTGATGGGLPFSTYKPTLGIQYAICYSGTFPGRSSPGLAQVNRSTGMIGEIRMFSGTNLPAGFLPCQGQILSISQYTYLFSVIWTNFGGDAATYIQLPNLQGFVPIGASPGTGPSNYFLGEYAGATTATLTLANLPIHNHTLSTNGATGLTGSGQPFVNLQPSCAVSYIIDENSEITMFTGSFVPDGWALCDGSLLPISDHPVLYGLIGTGFGGDGVTTFALPDLRGRAPIGSGISQNTQNQGGVHYTLGQMAGANTVTLTPFYLPFHNHTIPGGATGFTGSGQAFDNGQPVLGLNWLIAETGPTNSLAVGELRLVAGAGTTLGSSWTLANGQAFSTFGQAALYGVIGTTYGSVTGGFRVPDFSGRVAAGLGYLSPQMFSLGTVVGQEFVTLTTSTMPSHTHALPSSPKLIQPALLSNGTFQFSFTNVPGMSFTVLSSTNLSTPLSNWNVVTTFNSTVSGPLQFTGPTTNGPRQFYVIRIP